MRHNPLITDYQNRLAHFIKSGAHQHIKHIKRGLEKESLRITPEGTLSQQTHPIALGSALTHPYITTDYSEAQLELITPALTNHQPTPLDWLMHLHQYVYANIGSEKLWVNSMPCILEHENNIPIAQYGSSHIGKLKTLYREGLSHRYGKLMQTISGIHYNFSYSQTFWQQWQNHEKNVEPLQNFINDKYFGLIRNFLRYSWWIILLFGSSPAVCQSFLKSPEHKLVPHTPHTYISPFATSLRMSDLGYQNNQQKNLHICHNTLSAYVTTLKHATHTSDPNFESIGLKNGKQHLQLNTNILQIENEYYASIRPKRTTQSLETPSAALTERGVEYIEIRAIDLNPFEPIGISATQIDILDTLALYCLIEDSPNLTHDEYQSTKENMTTVARTGRAPGSTLLINKQKHSVQKCAQNLFLKLEQLANVTGIQRWKTALKEIENQIENFDLLPSAKVLATLTEKQQSFFDFAMQQAKISEDFFKTRKLSQTNHQKLQTISEKSLRDQASLERINDGSFDEFLKKIKDHNTKN